MPRKPSFTTSIRKALGAAATPKPTKKKTRRMDTPQNDKPPMQQTPDPYAPGYYGQPMLPGMHPPVPSHGASKKYQQTPDQAGFVRVVKPDGSELATFRIKWIDRDWWGVVSAWYPVVEETMTIPLERVKLEYEAVRFNACTYDATADYLSARWGRRLHSTDKDWLAEHQFANDGGVPTEYTPICLQALVEPYGMGISRIRFRKGVVSLGEETRKFVDGLGCNPFGMIDHTTTNAEAAAKLGLPLADMEPYWRLDFHDEPLPGSVIGEKFFSGGGVKTGAQGGHARYLAPRARANDWVVSIQFAPIDQIVYHKAIELPEYTRRRGAPTLMLEDVKGPQGELIVLKHQGAYYSPDQLREKLETATGKSKTTTIVPTASKPVQVSSFTCAKCKRTLSHVWQEQHTTICTDCWNAVWEGYACPTCKKPFKSHFSPAVVERNDLDKYTEVRCPSRICNRQFKIDDEKHKEAFDDLVAVGAYCVDNWIHPDTTTTTPTPPTPAPTSTPAQDQADGLNTLGSALYLE